MPSTTNALQPIRRAGIHRVPGAGHGNAAAFALAALLLTATAPGAHAAPNDDRPKLLLHVKGVTTKNVCTSWGRLDDCRQAETRGRVTTNGADPALYYVYLLAAPGPYRDVALGGNGVGIAGCTVGIDYTPGLDPHGVPNGVRIFEWTLCALVGMDGGSGWPQAGSSNTMTWDATSQPQLGETAVVGYFYLAAYHADELHLSPRGPHGSAGNIGLADTPTTFVPLGASDVGSAAFSPDGSVTGFNPCLAAVPTHSTTWSALKAPVGR